MTISVLFIHSAGPQRDHEGSSDLVCRLRDDLGPDFEVLAPPMPAPENPRNDAWLAEVAAHIAKLRGNAMLVGHSLGGSTLLKHLSEQPCEASVAAAFLVAAPFWDPGDRDVGEFAVRKGFAARLPANLPMFFYHARDDDVVPFRHMAAYAAHVPHAVIRGVDRGGHLFAAGLPELVRDIRQLRGASGCLQDHPGGALIPPHGERRRPPQH